MSWASDDGGEFNSAGPSTIRCANGPPPHRKSMGRIRMYPPGFVILNLFQDNKQPSPVILNCFRMTMGLAWLTTGLTSDGDGFGEGGNDKSVVSL